MNKLILIIAISCLGLMISQTTQAQISPRTFMSFPGDEELPIGVYPNSEDSLKNGKEDDETTGADSTGGGTTKAPTEGSKDGMGNPAGTIYSQGEIWTTVVTKVGTAIEDTETTDGIENWLGQVANELYDMPLPSKEDEGDDENLTIPFKVFSLKDNPSLKKNLLRYLNKKSKIQKWVSNRPFRYYFSKNKKYPYYYIYITDKKPNKKKPVPAKRFGILFKKSKVLFYRI